MSQDLELRLVHVSFYEPLGAVSNWLGVRSPEKNELNSL
jgi:hypothetical protein